MAAKRDASLLAGFAGASSWRVKRLEIAFSARLVDLVRVLWRSPHATSALAEMLDDEGGDLGQARFRRGAALPGGALPIGLAHNIGLQ